MPWGKALILMVHAVMAIDLETLDLLTPSKQLGEACGYESCPSIKEDMLNVHIVPHSHGELGYTRTFDGHYTGKDDFFSTTNINMKRILDSTISELWTHNERKFTFADFPYLFHWWANRDGTVRRMVYQLLRQGRLHFVGGGWSMSDESTTSYHAIIDHFTYSLRKINATFLECGRPLVSWQSDAFGHSREFASLIALMGFDGHFINPISFDDELARMRRKGMEFLWRGSDDLGIDTDIYTHKLFDGYWSPPGFCFGILCNDSLIITSDSMFTNVEERVDTFIDLMKTRQAPFYTTKNVMVIMGRRFGYYDASMWFGNIDKLIDEVNKKSYISGASMHLYYSTPACYLRAVHNANPALEVKQDDFLPLAYDKYTHATGMYTSRPTLKYMAREGHVYLQMAKQLQVLARLWNNDKTFEELSWIVGVFQDHNIITGALRIHVKNYYIQKMYLAIQRSTLLLKQAFNKLRKSSLYLVYYRCSFNISMCKNTNSKRTYIVIYNPLAWPVSIPVRIPVNKTVYNVYNPNLEKMNVTLTKIPQPLMQIPERESEADHELVFIADNLPPMGFRSYYVEQALIPRPKRSLFKKIKNKNKKYLIRQTSNLKIDDASLLDNLPNDYYYFDETTTEISSNIQFDNVTKIEEAPKHEYMLTSKPREQIDLATDNPEDTKSSTIKDNFYYQYDEEISPSTTELIRTISTTTEGSKHKDLYVESKPKIDLDKYMADIGYSSVVSNDLFIKNKHIRINLDDSRKVSSMVLSNGVNISLDIQYYFYVSDEPAETGRTKKKDPGAYIFRPITDKPEPIIDYIDTIVYKSSLVEELHCRYSSYVSFVLRLYEKKSYVEMDWLVGPLPNTTDNIGQDIFIRYMTDLENEGVFYTDSNGRQTMKRIRNIRATYDPVNLDPISGNFYPVTSKIYIEDINKNIRFSILNDRSQGGTSLHDGEIDLMVHRSISTDDSKIQAYVNESDISIRGKHYFYLSKADYKQNKIYEKILAKEIELTPQMFVLSPNIYSKEKWVKEVNEYSGLSKKLPLGIHILTLQEWNDRTILLRLENYLEKCDVVKNGIKKVFIKDLFVNLRIKNIRETTLAGNIWLKDWAPLLWHKKNKFVKNFNAFYGNFNESAQYTEDFANNIYEEVNMDEGIILVPQQIRTFVVQFEYVNIKIGNVL